MAHSPLSAMVGSTRVARNAGTRHTSNAVDPSTAAVRTNFFNDTATTENSRAPSTRDVAAAIPVPAVNPNEMSRRHCRETVQSTCADRAPKAVRIPISRALPVTS
jgi:hypothetical protein